ncbi:predicted protein [Naegleria gruberi]|uniref:Predicted protein n=1 Tax=Naegleria gruberi TaxID=5762 RepID=D2W2X3_NAEGR|nr:uncharacterized protein NAEGRDRAFT_75744 [Naegleria gruberi]EFC36591.1 predicted protein [Naegleria gruberi]|eukprot:XP_002669335.1 predicted protein [Naegleria gruberi strain NEG-M]
MTRVKIAILDVSDHVQLFEDDLFKKYMFTDDISECTSYHVAKNQWPSETLNSHQIVQFIVQNYDAVLIPGSEDCCMDDSLCYIEVLCNVIRELIDRDFPIFAVCFGAQAVSRALNGNDGVSKLKNLNEKPEFGIVLIDFVDEDARGNLLFRGIEKGFYSSSSHSDCFLLNEKCEHLLKSRHWKNQAYQVKDKLTFGLQFHPEMDLVTSEEIFKTLKDIPVLYDDNEKQVDMTVGKIMAKNFCEMVIKHKETKL